MMLKVELDMTMNNNISYSERTQETATCKSALETNKTTILCICLNLCKTISASINNVHSSLNLSCT